MQCKARRASHLAVLALGTAALALAGPEPAAAATASGRFILDLAAQGDAAAARASLTGAGARVVAELPELGLLVVEAPAATASALAASGGLRGLVPDHIVSLAPPEPRVRRLDAPGLRSAKAVTAGAGAQGAITPDPAFGLDGLLWNYRRIGLPDWWRLSSGDPDVRVAVVDTGLDFTHVELRPVVVKTVDFTLDERVTACQEFVDPSYPTDRALAQRFGGPATTDWNGHGSWIGGTIAAALNGTGTNGIAPRVGLVGLKISQSCGSAYDSDILLAFLWAANHGVNIVSISFGGYVDRTDPDQEAIYQDYVRAVAYARSKGTLIVAAAGNEHVRLAADGRVLSHGELTAPGEQLFDLHGLYELPGGAPDVVSIASTGNVVNPSAARCPGTSGGSPDDDGATAICKPRRDRHQAAGQGRQDQLAYYSNYGPGIDLAAPGGARKFNLPYWDRGGTPGFPYVTSEGTQAWEEFSVTSNWAVEIPCFTFAAGSGFPRGQCYSTIQGTSMATPHASAVAALLASAKPRLRHDPAALLAALQGRARKAVNLTQPLSATDRSGGDLTGGRCADGYCHLGGPAIPSREAYGAGIVELP